MEMCSSSEFSESQFNCSRYWGALSISITTKGCVHRKNRSTFFYFYFSCHVLSIYVVTVDYFLSKGC